MSLFQPLTLCKAPKVALVLILALTLSGCLGQLDPNQPAKIGDIVKVIGNIIKLLAPIASVAFFIMLIWGGFQLLFSGGDPKAAAAARNTFLFAIIGIFLVIISWLVLLLIRRVTGVDVTTVEIPGLP